MEKLKEISNALMEATEIIDELSERIAKIASGLEEMANHQENSTTKTLSVEDVERIAFRMVDDFGLDCDKLMMDRWVPSIDKTQVLAAILIGPGTHNIVIVAEKNTEACNALGKLAKSYVEEKIQKTNEIELVFKVEGMITPQVANALYLIRGVELKGFENGVAHYIWEKLID